MSLIRGTYDKILAVCLVAGLLSGCASIPERELENAFRYQRLKRSDSDPTPHIESVYQTLADEAWANAETGGKAQFVSILELGDDALLARIHLIRSAQRTLDFQTFGWVDDPTSRFIFDELANAAKRGVLVRLLIDALSIPDSPRDLARMARAHRNLEICLYKPLSDLAKRGPFGFWDNLIFKAHHMNRRMHNKLLLIDGRVGIAGGRNCDGRYFDRNPDFLFRDRDVLVAGPAVTDMQDSFELFWQDKNATFLTQLLDVQREFEKMTNGGEPLSHPNDYWMFEEIDRLANNTDPSSVRSSLKVYEADAVRFIYDTPRKFRGGGAHKSFDRWFTSVLSKGELRLVYQTPYLIYNRDTRKSFKALRKAHPGFRIVASSNSLAASDHISAYALSFKHRKELYKKTGIDIYEAKPYPRDQYQYIYALDCLIGRVVEEHVTGDGASVEDARRSGPRLCIHAKSFVLDGKAALIGSHNFDPRSAKLNTECGLFIDDEEIAQVLEKAILNACEPQNAWTVSKGPKIPVISHFSGLIGGISTALPVFDIWPFRYTTNYELKADCTPLSPRDPDFQANYNDVGYFPEAPDSGTVIGTQLLKAFCGWARPLM
jgi:cardiolipin synthase C